MLLYYAQSRLHHLLFLSFTLNVQCNKSASVKSSTAVNGENYTPGLPERFMSHCTSVDSPECISSIVTIDGYDTLLGHIVNPLHT